MGRDTGQADTAEDHSHKSPVQLQQAEQWIPVSSPTATIPLSPAAKDLNKMASINSPFLSIPGGCSDKMASPDIFMLHPSVQDQKRTPLSFETFEVDKFNIGYAPVDIHGKLLLDLKNTGGWRAAFFIFGTLSSFCVLWGLYMYGEFCELFF